MRARRRKVPRFWTYFRIFRSDYAALRRENENERLTARERLRRALNAWKALSDAEKQVYKERACVRTKRIRGAVIVDRPRQEGTLVGAKHQPSARGANSEERPATVSNACQVSADSSSSLLNRSIPQVKKIIC